ncbi:MAG: hypothetical protein H0X17_17210 [Deltaproteobacteria bacterium]|nr:hypothetical protein [Deltaproteobacteria bacterium]
MITRLLVSLGLATACGGTSAPPTSTTPATPTAPATSPLSGLLTPDGRHVASERVYEGNCAPAGSRGGCHAITLRPDGTYRNFLYDAAIDGTYVISGTTVKLTGSDPSMTEELALAADGSRLGELPLKP